MVPEGFELVGELEPGDVTYFQHTLQSRDTANKAFNEAQSAALEAEGAVRSFSKFVFAKYSLDPRSDTIAPDGKIYRVRDPAAPKAPADEVEPSVEDLNRLATLELEEIPEAQPVVE